MGSSQARQNGEPGSESHNLAGAGRKGPHSACFLPVFTEGLFLSKMARVRRLGGGKGSGVVSSEHFNPIVQCPVGTEGTLLLSQHGQHMCSVPAVQKLMQASSLDLHIRYFLSAYSAPGTIPDGRDSAVKKINKVLGPNGVDSPMTLLGITCTRMYTHWLTPDSTKIPHTLIHLPQQAHLKMDSYCWSPHHTSTHGHMYEHRAGELAHTPRQATTEMA